MIAIGNYVAEGLGAVYFGGGAPRPMGATKGLAPSTYAGKIPTYYRAPQLMPGGFRLRPGQMGPGAMPSVKVPPQGQMGPGAMPSVTPPRVRPGGLRVPMAVPWKAAAPSTGPSAWSATGQIPGFAIPRVPTGPSAWSATGPIPGYSIGPGVSPGLTLPSYIPSPGFPTIPPVVPPWRRPRVEKPPPYTPGYMPPPPPYVPPPSDYMPSPADYGGGGGGLPAAEVAPPAPEEEPKKEIPWLWIGAAALVGFYLLTRKKKVAP